MKDKNKNWYQNYGYWIQCKQCKLIFEPNMTRSCYCPNCIKKTINVNWAFIKGVK